MKHPRRDAHLLLVLILALFLTSCGGSGAGGSGSGGSDERAAGLDSANFGCDGACTNLSLSVDDVRLILSNALVGAQALGVAATVAVTDRVGNVLAVYEMPGAAPLTTVNGQIGAEGGLEGASVPSSLAAISKAGTGAFLSSQGNAFTTRTASQIVQENFNPGERNQPGGPLFGVQFSQFICSDVNQINPELGSGRGTGSLPKAGGLAGPRPLPLGLSADSGGIPLYKQGDLVGGLGIELDGLYTLDRNILDLDDDVEERLALIASRGFEAPSERVAPNMFVVGKSLRYTDLDYGDLDPMIEVFIEPDPSRLLVIPEYTNGTIRPGAVFGDASSGVLETSRAGVPAAILVDGAGNPRFPSRNGTPLPGGVELKAGEVEALLDSILLTAQRTRAAIRRPLDTAARVSIWVIDSQGNPLGFVRSQDAPVFGIDVALQKARGATFFSAPDAGAALEAAGLGGYVAAARAVIGPDALTGTHAFADRALGNLSRPFLPDGINGTGNGPFSHPFPGTGPAPTWSPFNTGIQLDLVAGAVLQSLGSGAIPDSCVPPLGGRLRNGIQIFPGSVPLYRDGVLVGGVGISGDGVDQDDLIAFYGSSRLALDFAGHTGVGDPVLGFNAPIEIRSDQIELLQGGIRLRYVNCPEGPFSGSNDQNVCDKL